MELFEEFKAYLQRNNFKQKEFSWAASRVPWRRSETQMEASGSEPEPQETDQTE